MNVSTALGPLILGGSVLVLLAVAALLSATASRKKTGGGPPPVRSFSILAGFAFWTALASLGAAGAGAICATLVTHRHAVSVTASSVDDLQFATAIVAAVAIVLAGLALLLSITAAAGLRGRPDRYGLGVCALTALVSALILAASFPRALELTRRLHPSTPPKVQVSPTPAPVTPPENP